MSNHNKMLIILFLSTVMWAIEAVISKSNFMFFLSALGIGLFVHEYKTKETTNE